jgi:sugar phosphate permease
MNPALSTAAPPAAVPAPAWRWVVLGTAWFCLLLTFVDRLLWGNVAITVGRSLALPVAALGVFVTAFYIGYVVANALGGIAADRFGPRVMLAAALVPLGCATALFGFTVSLVWGLAFQALMGLSAGSAYSTCVKLAMSWFSRQERGRAMGLLTTATSLGVVVCNAVVPTLMAAGSWQDVYWIFGAVTVGVGALAFLLLGRPAPFAPPVKPGSGWQDIRALFANRNLVMLALAGFWAMWATWGFTFWANALMIRGHHLSAVQAGAIVSLFGIGAVISKPLVGLLSDGLGGNRKKPLTIACFLGLAVALTLFGQLESASAFRLAAPFLGVFAFVYTPLMAALVGEAAGVAHSGAATGLTNAIWQLGSVVVPSVIGLLYQTTDSFTVAFAALAVGPVLAALCMLGSHEPRG